MAAKRIKLTDVHFFDSIPKVANNFPEQGQAGVQLPRVRNIKTELSIRQLPEKRLKFRCRPTNRLSAVHIFDQQTISKQLPALWMIDHIWMNNDVPSSLADGQEQVDYFCFFAFRE